MIISPYGAFLRIIVDLDSCRLVSSRAAPVRCRFKASDVEGLRLTQPPLQRRLVSFANNGFTWVLETLGCEECIVCRVAHAVTRPPRIKMPFGIHTHVQQIFRASSFIRMLILTNESSSIRFRQL